MLILSNLNHKKLNKMTVNLYLPKNSFPKGYSNMQVRILFINFKIFIILYYLKMSFLICVYLDQIALKVMSPFLFLADKKLFKTMKNNSSSSKKLFLFSRYWNVYIFSPPLPLPPSLFFPMLVTAGGVDWQYVLNFMSS